MLFADDIATANFGSRDATDCEHIRRTPLRYVQISRDAFDSTHDVAHQNPPSR
jgi:hypothetical protein